MIELKKELEGFSLSDKTRNEILSGSTDAPIEFERIARIVLAGHFTISSKGRQTIVRPTCVEFYYHEEFDDGIKDPIVYHRNPKNKQVTKPLFPFGVLHNHVSGIDITFEKGENPESAIRASMLIREYRINEEEIIEKRSTQIYESLFSQASIFDGFTVKWVDGAEAVDVESSCRKNVALYDANGEKIKASDKNNPNITENKEYIQDQRRWQFRIKNL